MKNLIYFSVAVFFVLSGCLETNNSSYKIVFLSNREAPSRHFDIFEMNADGKKQINLTPNSSAITSLANPKLSPDGKKILFLSIDGVKKLQIFKIDEHSISNVTDSVPFDPQMSFSPQGNKVIFIRGNNGHRKVFIVNSNGSDEKCLSNPDFDEFDPSFSFDGKKIIFVSKRDESSYLYTVTTDGTERKELMQRIGSIRYPVYSPNGDKISFCAYNDAESYIYLVDSDGTNLKMLVNDKVAVAKNIFTPDGSQIIFLSRQRGNRFTDICIVDVNGKNFKNLTDGLNYFNRNPQITTDGKSIIFESVQFNKSDIYRVNISDTSKMNLSNNPKWDQSPSL